ncbi:opy2-like protein [Sporothrix brasiliensis 5110]|uniref:Opy2-like protein n=1 Tax=Sporothrix brasiliensis 5110 TaxID=1398154 RepID=A0A0C2J225_9PEZI|nr:opy2-like protein [Sporothrix brasiliensis 5110]KIH93070.1 opy2-like protein [Sporothrix brasiliensis 5110]
MDLFGRTPTVTSEQEPAAGQSCQVTAPLTCTECPRSYCAADISTPTASPKSGSSPSTGAIAGGVVGGVAVIAIVTYLVWRFCIKAKRQQISKAEEDGQIDRSIEAEDSFNARRNQRASTHTVHSIASTVLTRASNIIQIAYIPGVMNRPSPTSPTVLVPPVPPIPIAISNSSQASTPAGTEEQHFFVPGDLRDSTYSGYSGFTDRTSYARTSYAPRSSIASTIYGKNAVIVPPPQTGMRIKPTMVNLKSPSNLGPNGFVAPPVPSVDYEKYKGAANTNGSNLRPVSAANSTFSVGSTFLNNASAATAMPARPVVVRVGNGPKKPSSSGSGAAAGGVAATTSETEILPTHQEARESVSLISPVRERFSTSTATSTKTGHESKAVTIIEDSPTPDQGPFSDPPASPSGSSRTGRSLSAVIEEATRRASQRVTTATSVERGRSPFGDENATHDI